MLKIIAVLSIAIITAFTIACGAGSSSTSTAKPVKSGPAGNNLTVTIANADGVLRKGDQNFTVTFADASGKPVDVGAASLNFFMPAMGSMSAMNNPATLTTTDTPGVYSGKADIEMSGEWQAQITYEGSAGKGSATIPVMAQ